MLRFGGRALVKVGMVKSCHLVKPVSATLVAGRKLTQQQGVPRQPVPPLDQTCDHYLSIVETVVEPEQLNQTKKVVEDFQKPGGVGERLQRGLERRARSTANWLTDFYKKADYLDKRKPLVIFSNTGGLVRKKAIRDINKEQTWWGSRFTGALLEIKTRIDNGTLPVDYIAGRPLCMKDFDNLMSSCRIPGPKIDSLAFWGKSANPPKHFTVAHNGHFFMMDAYNSDGLPLTTDQLYVQLERIRNSSLETNMDPVGILTTQHRDIWFKVYTNLIKDANGQQENRPSLQVITRLDKIEIQRETNMEPLPMPKKLHFNITPEIKKDIEDAKQHMDMLAQNLDVKVKVFDHFGKKVIKDHKMSPDGFVQMAIQLAYYRLNQQLCPTMEPMTLRMFREGRLALMNSSTSAAAAFVKAFDDPKKQNSEKMDLLEKAINTHRMITLMGISGQAVQGHLLGLRMQAVEEGIPMPDIFTDTSYSKAFDFKLITNQVTSRTGCKPCLGPEEPDVDNVYYGILNDNIDLTVSSFKKTKREDYAAHLLQAVEGALLDIRTLLEQTPRAEMEN
ncbi:carnitine O-acetyltransferase-like [Morone saxatilis]|uniref:carnitine O-acetyltransferase-like n=1 Tax=Morone saxatilis TaxID=34816 RepID=UPI0015E228B3|nr:carnitine O-acetyltransferase-like [Morone saxatilis]